MEKQKPIIVINGRVNREVLPLLEESGAFEIRDWNKSGVMDEAEMKVAIADADVLIVAYHSVVSRAVIAAGKKLKLIVQAYVGYEDVDVAACTEFGIPFCNTGSQASDCVAELGMALIFASARNITRNYDYVRQGGWNRGDRTSSMWGWDLHGSVLGILGMGHIGFSLAQMAKGCGMQVIYHNRHPRQDDSGTGMTYVSEAALYEQADVVAAVLPSTDATKHYIDINAFKKMKSSALFVNIGRGDTVRTDDLVEALQTGEIAQAAMDVMDPEPLPPEHPLLSLESVIITPHIGGLTRKAWRDKGRAAAQNILDYFAGKALHDCVNEKELHKVPVG